MNFTENDDQQAKQFDEIVYDGTEFKLPSAYACIISSCISDCLRSGFRSGKCVATSCRCI